MRLFLAAMAFVSMTLFGNPASASDFGFVTSDPFAESGVPAKKNDVTFLGGVYVSDTFGGAAAFWDANYLKSYMLGVAVGHDFYDMGAGFTLGAVAGVGVRFGSDEPDTTGELWGGFRVRHQGFLIGNLLISPGLTLGFSAVTGPTAVEREREIYYDGNAKFLGFVGPEIALRWRDLPNLELVTQLHHRSGAAGTLGNMGEGSNAWTTGLRIKF